MVRLPPLTNLAADIRAASWARNHTVGGSVSFLENHRADLDPYDDVEDLGLAAYDDPPDATARAIAVHLLAVRNALAEELWSREVFIGIEVLDELLFHAVKDNTAADPLVAALEFLRDRRVTRPGLVLFPLHSIGVLQAGLLRAGRVEQAQYIHPRWGIALSPQNNTLDYTLAFVERARRAFAVRKPIDPEDLRHWLRSRAKWLEINPILAIRITTQRGSYYDTESVVLSRVRAATAQLAMISVFQDPNPARPALIFSSSRTNNWETLDIRHYVVFADSPLRRASLQGDCVPIHWRGSRVVELCDLSIEIDPDFHGRARTIEKIGQAVGDVYRGHLVHMWKRRRNAQSRTYDRLFVSLSYFLRSFHNGGQNWSAAVALSTAFEMLLTDSYAPGVTRRLERRLGLVLRGIVGRRGYERAFADIYDARGDLVHAGTDPIDLDLHTARQAFVHAFCVVALRIARLHTRERSPMTVLTRDAAP
jgi:hypothetical protein